MERLKKLTEHTSKTIDFSLVVAIIAIGIGLVFNAFGSLSGLVLIGQIALIIIVISNREKIFKNFERKWKELKNFF